MRGSLTRTGFAAAVPAAAVGALPDDSERKTAVASEDTASRVESYGFGAAAAAVHAAGASI